MSTALREWRRLGVAMMAAVVLVTAGSCDQDQFLFNTIARRGEVNVAFINDTPYRAIFSFGTYDPQDQASQLDFQQLRLEGDSFTEGTELTCRRVVSVGGEALLALAEENEVEIEDEDAFVVGVSFSDTDPEDDLAGRPTVGTAGAATIRIGIDFTCETVVIFTFVEDSSQPGGFRVDLSVMR